MLFSEVAFLDRFERAAEAGFKAVEFLFPYDDPAIEIKPMARTVEDHWGGPLTGLVVTRYRYAVLVSGSRSLKPHPTPNAARIAAAQQTMEFVDRLHEDDILLCLISAGSSSLLPLPLSGITL